MSIFPSHNSINWTKMEADELSDYEGPSSSSDSETREKTPVKEHKATLTCFVQTVDGQKCALVSGHALKNSGGNIFVNEFCNESDRLGDVCHVIEDNLTKSLTVDAGLIKVREDIKDMCANQVYDFNRQERSCAVFTENILKLYDQKVIKCIPSRKIVSDDKTIWETSFDGVVASQAVHEEHRKILGNHRFLVVSGRSVKFAVEGESGTLLAVDMGQTDIYLIGYICGRLNAEQDSHEELILCESLQTALLELGKHLDNPLTLCKSPYQGKTNEMAIVCGYTILFKEVESIKCVDFKIDERIIFLLELKVEKDDPRVISFIKNTERQFRSSVFAREQLNEMAIFEIDRAEMATLNFFYFTVQHLYEQDYKNASKFLKKGMRSLMKVHQSGLRLLCKCVTYVTWLYLDKDELGRVEIVLKHGLEFFKTNERLDDFPKECLGYHYYDFSRYYVKTHQKENAISMAKKCYEQLQKMLEMEPKNKDMFNRYILGICQYSESLLWCGEIFEYSEEEVSDESISTAESLLKSIEAEIEDAPAVQRVLYLLAKCDLQFRKRDYRKAFKIAENCLGLAKQHNLVDEQSSAGKRCVVLRRVLKSLSKP